MYTENYYTHVRERERDGERIKEKIKRRRTRRIERKNIYEIFVFHKKN